MKVDFVNSLRGCRKHANLENGANYDKDKTGQVALFIKDKIPADDTNSKKH